jgi:hypothetical protein
MATPADDEQLIRLGDLFPNLRTTVFAIRGPSTHQYNCVAWAMGRPTEIWWPDRRSHWPLRQFGVNLKNFVAAVAAIGFEPSITAEPELGYEKIALYTLDRVPTHVARIESSTMWISKLGMLELIEHAPEALDGVEYGTPTHFFRSRTPPATTGTVFTT